MPEFKVIISDSNFPTVTMSYYITAATQTDVDNYFTAQYSGSPNFSVLVGPTDIGGGGVPTNITEDFVVTSDKQLLFRQRIVVGENSIIIGAGGSLIGV